MEPAARELQKKWLLRASIFLHETPPLMERQWDLERLHAGPFDT